MVNGRWLGGRLEGRTRVFVLQVQGLHIEGPVKGPTVLHPETNDIL